MIKLEFFKNGAVSITKEIPESKVPKDLLRPDLIESYTRPLRKKDFHVVEA